MGPPVKIDKIAVVFLTKNRESSVTRNKTRKTPKKLENSHNSSHHSRRLIAILKFHLPTTVWIDVSRSFRALLPSADQSECVDQSLSLSLPLSLKWPVNRGKRQLILLLLLVQSNIKSTASSYHAIYWPERLGRRPDSVDHLNEALKRRVCLI